MKKLMLIAVTSVFMFAGCEELYYLNLSNFRTNKVLKMNNMLKLLSKKFF